jgi:hypothetical protein
MDSLQDQSNAISTFQVMACVSADGTALAPFFVLKNEHLLEKHQGSEDIILPGTLIGTSANGWMKRSRFHKYMVHFIEKTKDISPKPLIDRSTVTSLQLKMRKY